MSLSNKDTNTSHQSRQIGNPVDSLMYAHKITSKVVESVQEFYGSRSFWQDGTDPLDG